MRRDTIEVLLCRGHWIKEAYGIRSLKEHVRNDPEELEFVSGYEMKDPNAPPPSNAKDTNQPDCATASVQVQVQASNSKPSKKNPSRTAKKGPQTNSKSPEEHDFQLCCSLVYAALFC